MSQKTSPFIEAKYGWNYGESNWNNGMDENLLKFSYLLDSNIDAIVDSLPAAVEGKAYYLTTDKHVYFVTDGVYRITPLPLWAKVTIKSTGQIYSFNGTSLVLVPTAEDISEDIETYFSASTGASLIGKAGGGTVQDAITALNGKEPAITSGTTAQYWRGDKTFQTLNKAAVGLNNVDNTSDANKPVSTATQAQLDAVNTALASKISAATVGSVSGASIIGTSRGSTAEAELTALLARAPARIRMVDNVAALRTVDSASYQEVFTNGYYTFGDAGAAQYYFDSTDTTSVDNGFDVIVAANAGRWKLVHNGTVHIEQGGGKPDNSTNTSPYLLTMLGSPRVREVVFGKGTYLFSGATVLPIGVTLRGIAGGGSQLSLSGNTSVFFLRSMTSISGFNIDCNTLSVNCFAFTLATSLSGIEYVNINDIIIYNSKGFLTDENHATNVATNVRVRSISSRLTKGRGIWLRDAFAFLECRDVAIDYIGNTAAQNYVGFDISFNEGSMFDNCEVTGTTGIVAGTNAGQIGYYFTSCKAVYLRRSFSDAAGGNGMRFSSCQYIRAELCSISLPDDHALYMISCTDVQITNMYVGGRRGITGATAGSYGCYLNACTRVMINALEVVNASASGMFSTASTTQMMVGTSIFSSNGGYGYITSAGSTSVLSNCLFISNTTGNYSLNTAFDHLSGCQSSSGALLNVTGPATA